jgi:hypothetical protein
LRATESRINLLIEREAMSKHRDKQMLRRAQGQARVEAWGLSTPGVITPVLSPPHTARRALNVVCRPVHVAPCLVPHVLAPVQRDTLS